MDVLIGWMCLKPLVLDVFGHPAGPYPQSSMSAAIELGIILVALFWANFVFARRVVRALQARRARLQGFD